MVAVALLLASCRPAEPKPFQPTGPTLTFLYAGDEKGEVAPCGCKSGPVGGLARRATAVKESRAAGPTVVVGSGDALFRRPEIPGPAAAGCEARARLILQELGRVGIAGMAVGERDLAMGARWLLREAAEAKVPLLAANVRDAQGKAPFAATAMVREGGKAIGLVGATMPGPLPEGLTAADPAPFIREAVAALRKEGAELVVGLLHLNYEATRKLLGEVEGMDLAMIAHEGRFLRPETLGKTLAMGAGDRGRQLGKLTLYTATTGPWGDAGRGESALQDLRSMERSRQQAEKREREAKTNTERDAYRKVAEVQSGRAAELRKVVSQVPQGRLYKNAYLTLDGKVGDDAEVASAVTAVVAKYGDADAIEGADKRQGVAPGEATSAASGRELD
jgi:2',3'-cyclic-nucleotide 2'-phosphodiesterase (5'-nucleotidase family)